MKLGDRLLICFMLACAVGWGELRLHQYKRSVRDDLVTRRLGVIDAQGNEWIVAEPSSEGAHIVIGDETSMERVLLEYDRGLGPGLRFLGPRGAMENLPGLDASINPASWNMALTNTGAGFR